jgi:hypothetical protein
MALLVLVLLVLVGLFLVGLRAGGTGGEQVEQTSEMVEEQTSAEE